MTTAPLDLAECRRIHEAMTPGPWRPGDGIRNAVWVIMSDDAPIASLELPRAPSGADQSSNARGIAYEHNTYGALLARIEALEAGLTEACDLASGHNIPGHNDYEADDEASIARLRALVRP